MIDPSGPSAYFFGNLITRVPNAMRKSLRLFTSALAFGASLAAAGTAWAVTVPLDTRAFTDGSLDNNDFVVFGGGVTMTFANIVGDTGPSATVDFDGIFFGPRSSPPFPNQGISSVDVVFSADVLINSYTVSFAVTPALETGTFSLSGSNGVTGANDASTVGTFAFDSGSVPVFQAGQTYSLSSFVTLPGGSNPNDPSDFFQLKEFDVTVRAEVIPLPASVFLLMGALGGMALWGRRRKTA